MYPKFRTILLLHVLLLLLAACNQAEILPTPTATVVPTFTAQPTLTFTSTATATLVPTSTPSPSPQPTVTSTLLLSTNEPVLYSPALMAWRSPIEGILYFTSSCEHLLSVIDNYEKGTIDLQDANLEILNATIWAGFGKAAFEDWHPSEDNFAAIKNEVKPFDEIVADTGIGMTMSNSSPQESREIITPWCEKLNEHTDTIMTTAIEDGFTEEDWNLLLSEFDYPVATREE